MPSTTDALERALDALARGTHGDAFALLGPHLLPGTRPAVVIRTCQPDTRAVEVLVRGGDAAGLSIPMRRLPQGIIFEAFFDGFDAIFDYRLHVTLQNGETREVDDPYRYGRVLGELDLHLLAEGTHYRSYERLGSHQRTMTPAPSTSNPATNNAATGSPTTNNTATRNPATGTSATPASATPASTARPGATPAATTAARTTGTGVGGRAAAASAGSTATPGASAAKAPATSAQATGMAFAVWAPDAERISVVGDFNQWNGLSHQMRALVPSGIWELFIPGLGPNERYKYEIRSRVNGALLLKADPYARRFETPPATASITQAPLKYRWRDADWIERRERQNGGLERPISIYEVHAESWMRADDDPTPHDRTKPHDPTTPQDPKKLRDPKRPLSYRELAAKLVPYVKDMGYTHIELLPILEHPYGASWGYQVTGYFAPTSRFGSPEDCKAFVDACHAADIGVILDWVPGHFPKDAHGLARFDGTALYEHADPRQGEHQDWGTLIFNYGRTEVRNFLLSSALFWLDEFHLDGLRVDAVASMLYLDYSREEGQWVPNRFGGRENLEAVSFLRELNEIVHARHPGVMMIAEESTAWPGVSRPVYLGGLGFTYKWNMGWMHDMLKYMSKDPIHRRWEHNQLTFSMLYAYNENFVLPFSHDEIVHGKGSMIAKMPGDDWQKAANLRTLYTFMYAHPGKKLMFMGDELAQWTEWNHDASLPWATAGETPHVGVQRLVRDLNALYRAERALSELDYDPHGFEWIDCTDNENSVVSFVRRGRAPGDLLVVVLNFTPIIRERYRVGVPLEGRYREALNSDAEWYGGSNVGNEGLVDTRPTSSHGHLQSLLLRLPPLGGLILKPESSKPEST